MWNPVKELKDVLGVGKFSSVSGSWNPVKELKVCLVLMTRTPTLASVESGEGIESFVQDCHTDVRHDVWNPVKELKVAAVFLTEEGRLFWAVESGEGIES